MKQKIRWGVIGSGGIAKRRTIPEGILKAKNAELAVVCSRDAKKNEETAKQFGAKPARTVSEASATRPEITTEAPRRNASASGLAPR